MKKRFLDSGKIVGTHGIKGELRRTQVITTYGPGAIVDLPDISVIMAATDYWNSRNSRVLHEANLQKLLGVNCFREPCAHSNDGFNESGTTPDTPAGEAKGTGTEADPFNSVAANNLATSLGSGEVSDKEYYIKGKIQEIKDQFAAQFGNATFYIADDENSQKFLIFRTYYFGGEKWKEGDGQLKIGDEVVVCAKLINYMGNTPETNQGGKLISVNGKTSIEGGSEKPDTPSTGDTTTPNGNFETWVDGKPNNWKTASSAGNASLAQSTDAHSGKYSVKVGGSTTANKRLGYKEMELKAGTYKIKYYVKAATATGASVQSGFVEISADNKPAGNYMYSGYINDITNTEWKLVEQDLVIPSDGTYCIVIMNSKKPGGDVLIDDLTLPLAISPLIC